MAGPGLSEDVFPIENGDIPASYVSFREGMYSIAITMNHFVGDYSPDFL